MCDSSRKTCLPRVILIISTINESIEWIHFSVFSLRFFRISFSFSNCIVLGLFSLITGDNNFKIAHKYTTRYTRTQASMPREHHEVVLRVFYCIFRSIGKHKKPFFFLVLISLCWMVKCDVVNVVRTLFSVHYRFLLCVRQLSGAHHCFDILFFFCRRLCSPVE